MGKLVTAWFTKNFSHLVSVVALALKPMVAAMPLDFATLRLVFGYMVMRANGTTATFAGANGYTAAEMQEWTESLEGLVDTAIETYNLQTAITDHQLARLLEGVAVRLTAP